jgi:N-acetyl-anhydromuramyl-L-alanine amidase AmpD
MQTPPFVQAKHCTLAHRARINLIVIHTMEIPEADGNAMRCALAFQRGARKASAHYCVDPHQVVQCVRETDVAWHAPMANRYGIGIELTGYAKQTAAEWADDASRAILDRAAILVADICHRRGIPAVKLSAADLLAGKRGICGHVDTTEAWHKSTHVDPGPCFPWSAFIAAVGVELGKLEKGQGA